MRGGGPWRLEDFAARWGSGVIPGVGSGLPPGSASRVSAYRARQYLGRQALCLQEPTGETEAAKGLGMIRRGGAVTA